MDTKIEIEENWIRSVVIPEILKTKNDNKNDDDDSALEIYDIKIKFIGHEEAFMLTSCYRALIDFKLNNQRQTQNLVIKKTPPLPIELYDSINFNTLFYNEILTYTKILPAIEKFTNKTFKVPKYIYSDLQRNFATVVLEDFGVSGYNVCSDKYNLSLEHILIAVKYLGNFHGIGFAMRDTQRAMFDDITKDLKESRFQTEYPEHFLLMLKFSTKRLLKATGEYASKVDESSLKKLTNMLTDYKAFGLSCVAQFEPYVTICHGDFLRNNIAFRYEENDNIKKPIEMMMFDLQTMIVSSPMIDLVVILSLSTFAEVRYKNFELIFESYRQELIKAYEIYTKQTAPKHFSYDALIKEFIRLMPYGINISSFFLMNAVNPPEVSAEDFIQNEQTAEEIEQLAMTSGGEIVDRELAHQVQELYELSQKYSVNIGDGLNIKN